MITPTEYVLVGMAIGALVVLVPSILQAGTKTTNGGIMTPDNTEHLIAQNIQILEAMNTMTEHVTRVMNNQNNLNRRLETLEREMRALNESHEAMDEWNDGLTDSNNTTMKRLNALESRQDPSCHNTVVPIEVPYVGEEETHS